MLLRLEVPHFQKAKRTQRKEAAALPRDRNLRDGLAMHHTPHQRLPTQFSIFFLQDHWNDDNYHRTSIATICHNVYFNFTDWYGWCLKPAGTAGTLTLWTFHGWFLLLAKARTLKLGWSRLVWKQKWTRSFLGKWNYTQILKLIDCGVMYIALNIFDLLFVLM